MHKNTIKSTVSFIIDYEFSRNSLES